MDIIKEVKQCHTQTAFQINKKKHLDHNMRWQRWQQLFNSIPKWRKEKKQMVKKPSLRCAIDNNNAHTDGSFEIPQRRMSLTNHIIKWCSFIFIHVMDCRVRVWFGVCAQTQTLFRFIGLVGTVKYLFIFCLENFRFVLHILKWYMNWNEKLISYRTFFFHWLFAVNFHFDFFPLTDDIIEWC